jgi:small basic protein (TIGR04137 family)
MSLDRSLKGANALIRHRNVLKRPERIVRLKEEERWTDGKSVYGLPKVANRKQEIVKAEKTEVAADGTAAAPAAGAAGAKAAAPAAGAKAAAPAAGAKGAAPTKGAAPAAKGAAAPAAKGKK